MKKRADREQHNHRAQEREIDDVPVPRSVGVLDRVGMDGPHFRVEAEDFDERARPSSEPAEKEHPDCRASHRCQQKLRRNGAKFQPTVGGEHTEDADPGESSGFLGQDQCDRRPRVNRQPAPRARILQRLPEAPQNEQYPEGEKSVDQRVLRHMDLSRRARHERRDPERDRGAGCAPGEGRGDEEGEYGERARNPTQGLERSRAERAAHPIAGGYVENPSRREKPVLFALSLDVCVAYDVIPRKASDGETCDVFVIHRLVEAGPRELRRRIDPQKRSDGEEQQQDEETLIERGQPGDEAGTHGSVAQANGCVSRDCSGCCRHSEERRPEPALRSVSLS